MWFRNTTRPTQRFSENKDHMHSCMGSILSSFMLGSRQSNLGRRSTGPYWLQKYERCCHWYIWHHHHFVLHVHWWHTEVFEKEKTIDLVDNSICVGFWASNQCICHSILDYDQLFEQAEPQRRSIPGSSEKQSFRERVSRVSIKQLACHRKNQCCRPTFAKAGC